MYTCFVSFCMVTRYLSYGSPNFDMGLFSQMFYYMKTTGTMNTTSERDYLLSHMCVHISPVFYLILPVYMLFSSPVTLANNTATAYSLSCSAISTNMPKQKAVKVGNVAYYNHIQLLSGYKRRLFL